MLTRRGLQLGGLTVAFGFSQTVSQAQSTEFFTIRLTADESVRSLLPPIAQQNLSIVPDKSAAAREMAARAPAERAAPVILIIIGAIALVKIVEMIHELSHQFYYGGVVIDGRKSPPEIYNDLKIPPDMVFVFQADGTVKQFKDNELPTELVTVALSRGK
jgi:hypothetical protein